MPQWNAERGEGGGIGQSTHAFSWDPARILIYALRALPANASASQLRDAIAKLHDFPGLFGMYDFRSGDQHGLTGVDFPLVRWGRRADVIALQFPVAAIV